MIKIRVEVVFVFCNIFLDNYFHRLSFIVIYHRLHSHSLNNKMSDEELRSPSPGAETYISWRILIFRKNINYAPIKKRIHTCEDTVIIEGARKALFT